MYNLKPTQLLLVERERAQASAAEAAALAREFLQQAQQESALARVRAAEAQVVGKESGG